MNSDKNKISKLVIYLVLLGDLLLMNILLMVLYVLWTKGQIHTVFSGNYWELMTFNSLCYLLCVYANGVILYQRNVSNIRIVERVTRNCLKFVVVSVAFIALAGYESISTRFFLLFNILNYILLLIWRIGCNKLLKNIRSRGRNQMCCIYIGSGKNLRELFKEMKYPASGYKVLGYFDYVSNRKMSEKMSYLGEPDEVLDFLIENKVHQVYCSLPSKESETILPIVWWCEKNFIHFYSVPNVRNYIQRRMHFNTVGDVPVLSLYNEPLSNPDNQFVKRTFDLVVSGLFLFTVFPIIFLIVGAIIKITSPGPIIFKQKRTGINGKEFWCYKFRSMRVNKDADKVQATKQDPRKTKFGDFIRKTNIDELPQLINVFKGEMSLVGPRPHMLKHTVEYSALIDNYLVRHWVKPGITGWAQVTGFRGETETLSQMEGRVKADIWYMEHWSFLLDLLIIYRTFVNVIVGEEKAY